MPIIYKCSLCPFTGDAGDFTTYVASGCAVSASPDHHYENCPDADAELPMLHVCDGCLAKLKQGREIRTTISED